MNRFFINRLLDHYQFTRIIALLYLLQSCHNNDKPDKFTDNISNRKYHQINLFSKENVTANNTFKKLSFDQAYESCKYVLFSTDIIKTDSSNTRGVQPFYLYKIVDGAILKQTNTHKLEFPVYFMSDISLFKKQKLNDSVYLFLDPIQQYEQLQKGLGIKYMWRNNAPFIVDKENRSD